jgi:RNA polymerase sigma-70 factor (ECF subfamily)
MLTMAAGRARTAMSDRDTDLPRRFAARDERALTQAFDQFGGPMLAVASRMLADRRLAEEAVQQAFVQAWRAAGRYDPARPLGPWLFAIVRRTAVDAWRRERRHEAHTIDEVASSDLPSIAPPAIEDASDAWELRRALDRLPVAERDVVRLAHLEQLSQTEIAARLEIPVGTVKSRTHSAYRKLRTALSSAVEQV